MEYKGVQKVNSFSLNNNELKQVIEKYFLDKTNIKRSTSKIWNNICKF